MDGITSLLKGFDLTEFLPELDSFLGQMAGWCRIFLLLGPVLLLAFGLKFFFRPAPTPKGIGFRNYYVTGSNEAWRFAQRLAGRSWMITGGVLLVVCGVLSLFLGSMDALTMATVTLVCICIQLVLVAILHMTIIKRTLKVFDKDGNRI